MGGTGTLGLSACQLWPTLARCLCSVPMYAGNQHERTLGKLRHAIIAEPAVPNRPIHSEPVSLALQPHRQLIRLGDDDWAMVMRKGEGLAEQI